VPLWHLCTLPITSLQPSKLHLDIGYIPPTDTGSLCLTVDSTHTVRRSGTLCMILIASNSSLKQSCSAFTTVTSALEVNFNVMRSINSRFTYLLYLLSAILILYFAFATENIIPFVHFFLMDSMDSIYTESRKTPLCHCPYLHQILTDFQHSFTGTFCGQCAIR